MRTAVLLVAGIVVGVVLAVLLPSPGVLAQEQAHPFAVGSHCRFAPMLAGGMEPTVMEVVGTWVRVDVLRPGGQSLNNTREEMWINTAQATVATCPEKR